MLRAACLLAFCLGRYLGNIFVKSALESCPGGKGAFNARSRNRPRKITLGNSHRGVVAVSNPGVSQARMTAIVRRNDISNLHLTNQSNSSGGRAVKAREGKKCVTFPAISISTR
jgi:hypothetical protein